MNTDNSHNHTNGFHENGNSPHGGNNFDQSAHGSDNRVPTGEEYTELNNQESEKYNPFVTFKEESTHFKEMGFWCGVNNADDPRGTFNKVLKDCRNLQEDRRLDLNISHSFDIERFEERIFNTEEEIEEICRKLEEQQGEIPILRAETKDLKKEIDGLKDELSNAYKKLGEAKTHLIDKRIQDAFKELDSLNEKYREIARKHGEINEEARNRNADAFEIKPNLLEHLQNTYTDAYDQIRQKAANLGLNGNWTTNPWYLRTFGLLAAFASGYFFSIFAVEGQLGNASISFFIFTGLFNFFGALTQSIPGGYLLATSLVILLPFVVLLISFFCQKALERHRDKQEKRLEDLKIVLNEKSEIQIGEANEDLYSFLLKNTPLSFVISIVFAFVTFGYYGATGPSAAPNKQLADLNTSLSSFTIGVCLSLAFAGIVYIYIIKIIEPRLSNRNISSEDDDGLKSPRFRVSIELIFVVLAVLLGLAALLIGLEKNFFFGVSSAFANRKAFLGLSFFIVSVLLTAFTFGYGIYFGGVIEAKIGIERKLRLLVQKLAYNSFPSIKPALLADKTFGIKYVEIANKLLKLISDKTDLAKQFIPKSEHQMKRPKSGRQTSNFLGFLPTFVRKYFDDNRSENQRLHDELDELNYRIELPVEDEYYFPEIANEINGLEISLKESRKRMLITESDIRSRQEEKSDYIKKLNDDKAWLEEKMKDWNKYISFLNREQFKEIERFNRKCQREISELNNGFNLALWFITSGGTPPPDPNLFITSGGTPPPDPNLKEEKQNGREPGKDKRPSIALA
jgi:predicted  nucleic acid-binding Zn-ribbon protein